MLRSLLKLNYNGALQRLTLLDWIKKDSSFILEQLKSGQLEITKDAHQLLMENLFHQDPDLYASYLKKKAQVVARKNVLRKLRKEDAIKEAAIKKK